MLLIIILVALVVDAAVVPSETTEVVVYTTKFDNIDHSVIDNGYRDRTVNRMDNKRSRQELKTIQQFITDRIPSQKPPAQVSWLRDARRKEDGVSEYKPQQDNRAEKTRKDQETRLQAGRVNDRDLYAEQSVKDGIASALSGQSQAKTTRMPDFNTSLSPDGSELLFESKRVRSGTISKKDEANEPQPGYSGTTIETKNIQRTENSQIFSLTSGNNAGFDGSKTKKQNTGRMDSKIAFSANSDDGKTDLGKIHGTRTEAGNQRFDYNNPGNIDRYDAKKSIKDDNNKKNSYISGSDTEETVPGNKRSEDNGGTHKNDGRRTGSKVGGNKEDDDGKIYFEPDLERRDMTERTRIVSTTPATVTLDNRNAFDVNVICGPGMEKIAGGVCAPTE